MEGWDSFGAWLEHRQPQLMDGTGNYAVLVPIVTVDGAPHILYEVRASHMRRQPGEICFPGGRMEPGECPVDTALRECSEELGISSDYITVLGQLDFVVHRTNYLLHPILASVELCHISINPDEVAETFLVPLSHLLNHPEEVYGCTLTPQPDEGFTYDKLGMDEPYRWQIGREQVPIYRWRDYVIWGITGKITRNLLNILSEGGAHYDL